MGVSADGLRAGKAVIELGMVQKGVDKALKSVQAKLNSLGKSGGFGGGGFGGGGFGGGGGGGGGFNFGIGGLLTSGAMGAALAWPAKIAADMEIAAAKFTVFTGSVEKSKGLLKEMQAFAGQALIPVQNLNDTAAMLLRYNLSLETTQESVEALAEISGGNVDEFEKIALAFAQVNNMQRLQANEMLQFKNTAFNPLREIADKTGETMGEVTKRMEEGGISADEVTAALINSTRAGGRFHGLLKTISGTLTGKWNKALAQISQALLPLGEAMIAPMKSFMTVINDAIPLLGAFVKNNAGLIAKIISIGVAIAAAGAAFFVFILAAKVVLFVMSSLASVFGLLFMAISPMSLLGAALLSLAAYFLVATEAGRNFVNTLYGYFSRLWGTALKTFQGIADALAAGDIALAGRVAMAGLWLAWLQGTERLRQVWRDFKDVFVRVTIDAIFGALEYWHRFKAEILKIWASLGTASRIITEKIGHWWSRSDDPELAAMQDAEHEKALRRIEDEGMAAINAAVDGKAAALKGNEAARAEAQAWHDKQAAEAEGQARNEMKQAEDALAKATEEAKVKAEAAKQMKEEEKDPWSFNGGGGLGGLAAASQKASVALFDTRNALQQIGNSNEELVQLKIIAKNTSRWPGPPVVA